jgi:antitoxin (DNA-binding transcriptional repressor) of toxin-antitoxin stability system
MRNDSAQILRAVADGESFLVTNGGQVAALISPPSDRQLDRSKAQGQVRSARRSVADLSLIERRKAQRTSAELVADARRAW